MIITVAEIKGGSPGEAVEEIMTTITPEMQEEQAVEVAIIMIITIAVRLHLHLPGIPITTTGILTIEVICMCVFQCTGLANCYLWLITKECVGFFIVRFIIVLRVVHSKERKLFY